MERASLVLQFKGSFKAAESLATEGVMQIEEQRQKYPLVNHVGIKGTSQACLWKMGRALPCACSAYVSDDDSMLMQEPMQFSLLSTVSKTYFTINAELTQAKWCYTET